MDWTSRSTCVIWIWLRELLKGNLGYSYDTDRPVLETIAEAIPPSLLLQGTSIGVALMVATLILLANLITDIAYAFVDPRVRYE